LIVSIEVPVIRGGWLIQCVDSVLAQTSPNWTLSLLSDGGDALALDLVDRLGALDHPRIRVHVGGRLGIARARQFLSERSYGDLILPLDDDDVLAPRAVEHLVSAAIAAPWAGIIRARRSFIDERGETVSMPDWFSFERRHYYRGATLDISNHSQLYAVRRNGFLAAGGWTGFEEFLGMGEDCSCFATMESISDIVLLDEVLYQYRLHGSRTSHRVTETNADEMWRRIADHATTKRGAPVTRLTQRPPFAYAKLPRSSPSVDDVEVVIPFWETDQREVPYQGSRPQIAAESASVQLLPHLHYVQWLSPSIQRPNRLSVAVSSLGAVNGELVLALFSDPTAFSPDLVLRHRLTATAALQFEFVNIDVPRSADAPSHVARIEFAYEPWLGQPDQVLLHMLRHPDGDRVLMRLFENAPGHCRKGLNRCLASLESAGFRAKAIHVVEERTSSAANRNTGIRACSAPWILFMDDDATLQDAKTLPTMIDAMIQLDADLAGPKLLNGVGRIYSGLPEVDPLLHETRVAGMGDKDLGQHDVVQLAPWLPSTVLLVHRSVIEAAGGFDERFQGSQHEDADFTLRARSRGFDCCYVGAATGFHYNELRNSKFSSNSAYLAERWKSRPDLFTYPLTKSASSMRKNK
jgi:GT2 family glycosyltransferase